MGTGPSEAARVHGCDLAGPQGCPRLSQPESAGSMPELPATRCPRQPEPHLAAPQASGMVMRERRTGSFITRFKARPLGAHGRCRPSRALLSPSRARPGPRRPATNGTMRPGEKTDACGGASPWVAPRAKLRIRGGAGQLGSSPRPSPDGLAGGGQQNRSLPTEGKIRAARL